MAQWYSLYLNPEPWEVPPLDVGRKGGKVYARAGRSERLYTYQQAVKEELEFLQANKVEGLVSLEFYFWRQSTGKEKGIADATNLQKALEDGLQGVLFDNDTQVRDIRSVIVDQRPELDTGYIVIRISPFDVHKSMEHYLEGLDDVRPNP